MFLKLWSPLFLSLKWLSLVRHLRLSGEARRNRAEVRALWRSLTIAASEGKTPWMSNTQSKTDRLLRSEKMVMWAAWNVYRYIQAMCALTAVVWRRFINFRIIVVLWEEEWKSWLSISAGLRDGQVVEKKKPKPGMLGGLDEFIKPQAQVEANFRKM